MQPMTSLFSTIAVAMGASWVSGINLYACTATLGLLSRFAHLQLPGELQVLTSWWVIGVATALYVVEFVADKVPIVDSVSLGGRASVEFTWHQGGHSRGVEFKS